VSGVEGGGGGGREEGRGGGGGGGEGGGTGCKGLIGRKHDIFMCSYSTQNFIRYHDTPSPRRKSDRLGARKPVRFLSTEPTLRFD